MLYILLKSFGMKNIKAIVDADPHDGDMAKNKEDTFSIRQRNIKRENSRN